MPIELKILHSKSWSGNWGPEIDELYLEINCSEENSLLLM